MHPYCPWLFRSTFPWHRLSPTAAPFSALRSPTHYRGWRVTFSPLLIRLDLAVLRQAGYPDALNLN